MRHYRGSRQYRLALTQSIDGIEHIAPVRDVLHVLEGIVVILPGRSQEFIGCYSIGLSQIKRFANAAGLVNDTGVERAPRPGFSSTRDRVRIQVTR